MIDLPIVCPDPRWRSGRWRSLRARFRVVAPCLALACSPLAALEPCGDDGPAAGDAAAGSPVPVLQEDWSAAESWTPGEWQVASRDAGVRIREGCVTGVIEAPLAAVRQVMNTAAEFDEFLPRMLVSEVEPVEPGVYLNTQVLDLPFPFRNRRYTVRVESGSIEAGAVAGWQARWTYIEGSGNVRDSRGSWTLVPLNAERTAVVYRLFTDPGGGVPAWLVNSAGPGTLRRMLDAVRERVLARCAPCQAPPDG